MNLLNFKKHWVIFLICSILFTVFLAVSVASDQKKTVLKLATATAGGNYYPLGKSIKSICENSSLEISVIETKGSVENIHKISSGEVDLAIVQNDIAFFAENGLSPFENQIEMISGIITFFPEPIYILTNSPVIQQVNQLVNKKVNVGPLGSGLYTDAKIILNSIKLWDLTIRTNHDPSKAIELLLTKEIQAVFINSISPNLIKEISEGNIFLITLSEGFVNSLKNTYPYFTEFNTTISNRNINTIAVKSMLICRENMNEELVYEITEAIYQNFESLVFPPQDISLNKTDVVHSMSLLNWHSGAERFYNGEGLKSTSILKYIWLVVFIPFLIMGTIILINILLSAFNRQNNKIFNINSKLFGFIRSVNLTIIKHKYITILFVLVTVYLTTMVIVQYIEHDWAIHNNMISNFDDRPFVKNLLWMFVFGGSGYNDQLFPQSPLGKFFVTLLPLIGIGGFIAIVGLLTSDHIKKKILQAKGVKIKMVKNHIILCGWNENVPYLVQNFLHKNIAHKKPIVILADIPDELPLEKYHLNDDLVTYVKGDAENREDLARANLKDATIAIIVSDSSSSDPDAKNILKVLTIEKYCQELENSGVRKNKENIYTIVEINDAKKSQLAYDAFVDEIISLGHIKSKIFVQSVLNPGVSKFINEVLTYNEFNDIYSIKIEENSKLLNRNFDEILILLRKHKILLLSICIENHRDKRDVEIIKEKYNLKRGVITNPLNSEECSYITQVGDILIVLAQYEKNVDKAIKSLRE